jgi:hypothetical protein
MPSKAIETALLALAAYDDMVVNVITFKRTGLEDGFSVGPRGGDARFNIPPASFRKMRRDGWVELASEQDYPAFVATEYTLTDAGRNALAAAR